LSSKAGRACAAHAAADWRAARDELRRGAVSVRDVGDGAPRDRVRPGESAEVAPVAEARARAPPAVRVRESSGSSGRTPRARPIASSTTRRPRLRTTSCPPGKTPRACWARKVATTRAIRSPCIPACSGVASSSPRMRSRRLGSSAREVKPSRAPHVDGSSCQGAPAELLTSTARRLPRDACPETPPSPEDSPQRMSLGAEFASSPSPARCAPAGVRSRLAGPGTNGACGRTDEYGA
jgi:hypothetical protein